MTRRMPPTETVRMALTTLRSNRLRSLLTMVGIVIGNASVITLVGVGRGAQGLAEEQLSNLGANVLFVVPGNNDTRRRGVAFPKTLVLEDAEAIVEQVPSVRRVAPQITSSQVVQAGARTATSSISGITASDATVSPPICMSEQSIARMQLLTRGPKEMVHTATMAFVACRRLCLPVTFGSSSAQFSPM